jgi:2-C-methyl-D-erythritol 2,4-cyclodiphosphate synthase
VDRVGIGYDVHRLAPNRRLVLAHVPIEFDRGPLSHSDGDVVLHAVIDALLGAAGLPDIGEMFPDTDPRFQGADSGGLLAEALAAVRKEGYAPVNVDVIVHAERPKLLPYKRRMRAELARLLAVEASCVNVKAKTGEGLGPIGTGEAIACTAVAGLRRVTDERDAGRTR